MKIVVCVKQVPEAASIKINPTTGTLRRDGVVQILNPHDACALSAALRLRELSEEACFITVITMGLPQATITLRECLSMGADSGVLVTDPALSGSDTYVTSLVLSRAIETCGGADIILTGLQTTDGDTAQVGPQIAARLNIPQMSGVQQLEIDQERTLTAHCKTDTGVRVLRASTPVLLTVDKTFPAPPYLSILSICQAYEEKSITVLNCQQLGLDPAQTGQSGSPTQVVATFPVEWKHKCLTLEGSPTDQVQQLLTLLHQEHLI